MQEYSSIQSLLFLSTKQTSSNKAAKNVTSELHKPLSPSQFLQRWHQQDFSNTALQSLSAPELKANVEQKKEKKKKKPLWLKAVTTSVGSPLVWYT